MNLDASVLSRIARALPVDFRERVFDPAVADLILDGHLRRRGASRRLAEVRLLAECVRLLAPRILVRPGPRVRPLRAALLALAMAMLGALVLARAAYPPRAVSHPAGTSSTAR